LSRDDLNPISETSCLKNFKIEMPKILIMLIITQYNLKISGI